MPTDAYSKLVTNEIASVGGVIPEEIPEEIQEGIFCKDVSEDIQLGKAG